MTTGLIGGLLVAVAYLAKLWRDSKAENAELKAQIASLKRQLVRNGRAR
jgi:hypothetical protein